MSDMLSRCAVGAVACCLLSAGEASAGKWMLIPTHETISHVGHVSLAKRSNQNLSKVGYKYMHFEVFWIDIWTSGGTYCVYDGDEYDPIEPAEAAHLLDKAESSLFKPFRYVVPSGWLLVGGLVAFVIVVGVRDKWRGRLFSRLLQQPEYQMALQVLNAEYAKASVGCANGTCTEAGGAAVDGHGDRHQAAFAGAVQHLVTSGVPWEEAERNLMLIVQALSQPQL